MIVLDSTSKSLVLNPGGGSVTCVVAYWSIDTAGLWIPGSYETSPSGGGNTVVLAAPSSGYKYVVENVFIFVSAQSNFNLKLQLNTSEVYRTILSVMLGSSIAHTIVLKRDGSTARLLEMIAVNPTAMTQTVN